MFVQVLTIYPKMKISDENFVEVQIEKQGHGAIWVIRKAQEVCYDLFQGNGIGLK